MTDIDDPTTRAQQTAEQVALFRAYRKTHDSAMRDQLVCAHLELVHSVARRFMGLGESLEDLVQEGSIGLLNAVDLFDPDRGVKFSTYACHLIIGQIQHYLRDRGRLIRQPAWVQELNTKVARATEQLFQQLGRDPQVEEIAAHLHLTEDVVQNVISARELNRVLSLSAPAEGTG
ncbi:MAG TPA: sigma-70 family RNA polymerase sigma factor, partial [Armatimonadota bacterium]